MSNGKNLFFDIEYLFQIAKRLISLLLHDIFRGPMKDECISNSSTQQPSPAIQSSSPDPTLRPSHLLSSPSSQVPTVQSNDDDMSFRRLQLVV